MGRAQQVPSEVSEAIRQTVASDPDRAMREARRAASRALEHRRLAGKHRRRAQEAWSTFEEFKRNLESLGIKVVIEPSPTPQGGASEHHSRSPD